VKSTEARIFNFSVVESVMMVGMAGLQVFIVRFFFQGARKGMFFGFFFAPLYRFVGGEQGCRRLMLICWFV